jgi:uncharacterized protein YecE (DUF72 family)
MQQTGDQPAIHVGCSGWFYFNNDREGFAIRNARQMREELCATL